MSGSATASPTWSVPWVEGRTLADELVARRPGLHRSVEWIAALAEALEHAHGLGVIHRDVKPSNILINRQDHVYLTDSGLAKSDSGDPTLTIDGQMIGTPAYMAPEQTHGARGTVDARTDLYSLGVILYELLTGTRPFAGAGRLLLVQIQEEDPRPPRRLDEAIPRDLETICLKAMAKEPGRRYADAAAFAADLRRWLRGEPVLARPVGPFAALGRKCRRRPVVAGLAASLVLAIVLGCAGVTWQWRRAESQRRRVEWSLAAAQQQRHRAIRALRAGFETLSSLLPLDGPAPRAPGDPRSDHLTLWKATLRYCRSSLQGQLATDAELRGALSSLLMRMTNLVRRSSPADEALRTLEETRGSYEGLLRDDPSQPEYRD